METLSIFLIIVISRNGRTSGPAFSYVPIDDQHTHVAISFTVPEPQKMGYYYLLGGNDVHMMQQIRRLQPAMSKVSDYNCQHVIREPECRYYRVMQIGCGTGAAYSPIIDTQAAQAEKAMLGTVSGILSCCAA